MAFGETSRVSRRKFLRNTTRRKFLRNTTAISAAAITGRGVNSNRVTLQNAQKRLEAALVNIESPYAATADGLTFVIAWGLPYFRTSSLSIDLGGRSLERSRRGSALYRRPCTPSVWN